MLCCPQVSIEAARLVCECVLGAGAIRNRLPELVLKGNALGLTPLEMRRLSIN